MDPEPAEPEVIREQIEETRSSLTEKLETLEAEVKGTVQNAKETVEDALAGAKETVQDTITSVKESVQGTVDTVKRTFDVGYQVDQRPFVMVGLSFVGGLVAGMFVGKRTNTAYRVVSGMSRASGPPEAQPGYRPQAATWTGGASAAPARPGFFDKLTGQLGGEMDKVKDLAINALVKVVNDVAQRSVPALASQVEQMMTSAASRFTSPQPHDARADAADVSGRPGYHQPSVP